MDLEFSITPPAQLGDFLTNSADHHADWAHRTREFGGSNYVRVGGHRWIGYPMAILEPWPTMGYVQAKVPWASVSSFITLGLLQPVDVAEKVVTMDHLSKGKFVFLPGLGWRAEEFAAIGAHISQRVGRFEESLELCKLLWTGEPVTYHGKYFSVDDARLGLTPIQKPHPPIWIAAQSEAAARRAARIGDSVNIPPQVGHDDFDKLMSSFRDELEHHGKPYPDRLPCRRWISVDRDRAKAVERLRGMDKIFTTYFNSPYFTKCKLNFTFEEEPRERTIAGTPEEVVEGLARYVEGYGANLFELWPVWPSSDPAEVDDHLHLLGEEVLAPLRARFADARRAF